MNVRGSFSNMIVMHSLWYEFEWTLMKGVMEIMCLGVLTSKIDKVKAEVKSMMM